jgi:hypothetical protein
LPSSSLPLVKLPQLPSSSSLHHFFSICFEWVWNVWNVEFVFDTLCRMWDLFWHFLFCFVFGQQHQLGCF